LIIQLNIPNESTKKENKENKNEKFISKENIFKKGIYSKMKKN